MSCETVFADKGLTGLANIANTCYINTCVHLLRASLPLSYYFINDIYQNDLKEFDNCSMLEFVNLLKEIWNDNGCLNPKDFYISILQRIFKTDECYDRFAPNEHHDLNEFMVFYIDYLHDCLSKPIEITVNGDIKNARDKIAYDAVQYWKTLYEKQYSIMIELFYGQYISVTECPECNHRSYSYESFSTVNLPISLDDSIVEPNIYHCFDVLTKTEQLDTDNKLECDGCKTYQQVTKKLYFWETPSTIILFFNRFLDIANSDKEIEFPIDNLDLNKYCFNYNPNDKNVFNLIGIGIYCGNGQAGHYSAIIKNQNGKWYHIDDEDVNEINEDIIIHNKKFAYCLVYQKCS